MRNVCNIGLNFEYRHNRNTRSNIQRLMALPLLPAEHIKGYI